MTKPTDGDCWPRLVESTFDPIAKERAAQQIARGLREHDCPTDREFDRFFPSRLMHLSGRHWTPLRVAMLAAKWVSEYRIESVLDIGAGPGKFCVAAALAGSANYVGLEQRADLVTAARDLVKLFELQERVTFIHAPLGGAVLPRVGAYYMYNPFDENLQSAHSEPNKDAAGVSRYMHDSQHVDLLLRSAKAGTYLLTYAASSADLPVDYCLVRANRDLNSVLALWRKR